MNIQVTFKNKLLVISVVLIGVGWLGLSRSALISAAPQAVQIAVLSPSGSATDVVGEGDDYFTQVLGQPRSMDHQDDLMFQSFGVTNIAMANGIWSGTGAPWSADPRVSISGVWPVYPGFTQGEGAQLGNYGWNHPVKTSQYQQLSFRVSAPVTTTSWSSIHLGYSVISHTYETGNYFELYRKSGWDVYNLNLSDIVTSTWNWDAQPQVYGLAYLFGIPGNFKIDWMRLTNAATSPIVTVTYMVTGTTLGDTVDLNCYISTTVTDDNYCGPITTSLPVNVDGTYTYFWHTAYLAPGSYYVQAIVKHSNSTASDVSQGPLTIKPSPIIHFDAPSMTSGPDYATVELGNPWDMNDSSDIKAAAWVNDLQAPCPCFSNGELYATTVDHSNPKQQTSDPYVYLRVDRLNHPIDTSKYKYLTYRYKIDGPKLSNSADRWASDYPGQNPPYYPAAWLVRLIFFATDPPDVSNGMNQTNDIIVFDGWNTYQMDLSKGLQQGYWETDPGQQTSNTYWTGSKYYMRFDFLEGYEPWTFHLDDVKLTGNDQANTSFAVQWKPIESGTPTQVDFYANSNPAQCGSGTPFSSWSAGGQPPPPLLRYTIYLPTILSNYPSANVYRQLWDTSQVAAGSYFVCAIASDGYNTSRWVSETPVDVQH
jgi:hypothetical protein